MTASHWVQLALQPSSGMLTIGIAACVCTLSRGVSLSEKTKGTLVKSGLSASQRPRVACFHGGAFAHSTPLHPLVEENAHP